MHPTENIERSFYHFSFLRDTKIHGIYLNTLTKYLSRYPFLKKPHHHDFYTILLFTGGSGTFTICNEHHIVRPDTFFLISPNQIHSFEDLENAEGILFFFCQDFYVEEFSFIRLLNVFSYFPVNGRSNSDRKPELSDSEIITLADIVRAVQKEYETSGAGNNSAVIIRSLLNIFLLKLSDFIDPDNGNPGKSESTIIHSLSNLIESNFTHERSIGFYTFSLNISEKHLNDICLRHFKSGLKSILQERVMQESRRLLLFSELSISQIAYKLNFEDDSYFNKVFRKRIGLTPKKFREMHKKLLP